MPQVAELVAVLDPFKLELRGAVDLWLLGAGARAVVASFRAIVPTRVVLVGPPRLLFFTVALVVGVVVFTLPLRFFFVPVSLFLYRL